MMTDTLTAGTKYDDGKIRWDLLPYQGLEEVARLYTFGATKYESHNWRKGISYSRCFSGLMRHLYRWWVLREKYDSESGCHHLAAVIFYCLNFMQYEWDGTTHHIDDRWKP